MPSPGHESTSNKVLATPVPRGCRHAALSGRLRQTPFTEAHGRLALQSDFIGTFCISFGHESTSSEVLAKPVPSSGGPAAATLR